MIELSDSFLVGSFVVMGFFYFVVQLFLLYFSLKQRRVNEEVLLVLKDVLEELRGFE